MKLLFENWRKYLKEDQKDSGLLYHATLSGKNNEIVNSFIKNGADPTRAGGFGQGKGFYLWSDKKDAQHYIKGLVHGMTGASKEEEVKGDPIIVVVDTPITPQNFDIDYELYAKGFIGFVENNLDYFKHHGEKLGIRTRLLDKGLGIDKKALNIPGGSKMVARWDQRSSWESPHQSEEYGIDVGIGELLGAVAAKLHDFDPLKYEEFEKLALPTANAIKYNGEEKIWPLRIEDPKGNVLWSRE
jgi:hypothetical protein